MKKKSQIVVKSTRKYTFGRPGVISPDPMEFLEDELLEEDLPEEMLFPESTDRPAVGGLFDPKALQPKSSTLTSYGIFSREEDGSYRITYEDSEATGLDGCLTTFCLSPTGMLILLRRGEIKTCMVFEKGHRHLCDYGVGGEIPSVVLHTHEVKSDLTEQGGSLFVDYSVEIRGIRTERNELLIQVKN